MGSDLRQPGAVAYVYAFERETGAVRWRAPVGSGAATDLSLSGSSLYAVTLADEILALDVETGRRLWTFSTGATNEGFLLTASPAVASRRVFFGGLDGILYALEAASGRLIWKKPLGGRISAGVAVGDGSIYAGTSGSRLYRVLPETGEIGASIETEGSPNGRLAVAGGCVLSFLGNRELACFTPALDRALWTRTGAHPWSSSRPYVARGVALAGNEEGELVALRLIDGEAVWSEMVGGTIRGVGLTEEGLYVGTLKGEVHARPWPRAEAPALRQP
ncbi:MAG TPA: PQQ-binding-like beta-propeller repeat protein [Thermoanaerobaculia bacterium]|nr:PQQ-binding-like beta-propeller repeat protein [Thermoanaerobaculia bacterium]